MAVAPSASYSLTVRLEIKNRPGMLGRVASAIGQAGGDIGAVDLDDERKPAAARALAAAVVPSELSEEYIIPSVNKAVAPAGADGVAAHATGVARRRRPQEALVS